MKHIELRYHFIKDHILKGKIELIFVNTHEDIDDVFTKALGAKQTQQFSANVRDDKFGPTILLELIGTAYHF